MIVPRLKTPSPPREEWRDVRWTAAISVSAYGVSVGVRTTDARLLERAADHFPPGWRPRTSAVVQRLYSIVVGDQEHSCWPPHRGVLYADGDQITQAVAPEDLLVALESDLQLYVAEMARRRVFLHAGAVGWRGRAIVVPGRSYSGKTTLVAELVRAGATYYSDEYAVLDKHGQVHPYAGPLSIRQGDGRGARRCSPEALGGRAGRRPVPPGLVILSEFRSGARWEPRRLSPGHAVLAMLTYTVPARRDPTAALATLRHVAMQAPVFTSARGEVRDAAASLLELVERMPPFNREERHATIAS